MGQPMGKPMGKPMGLIFFSCFLPGGCAPRTPRHAERVLFGWLGGLVGWLVRLVGWCGWLVGLLIDLDF